MRKVGVMVLLASMLVSYGSTALAKSGECGGGRHGIPGWVHSLIGGR